MILVEVYSKENCHLCVEAMTVLERVRSVIPFSLKEIKIARGDPQFEEYQELVPVVHINKILACKTRIDEAALKRRLEEAWKDSRQADDAGGVR